MGILQGLGAAKPSMKSDVFTSGSYRVQLLSPAVKLFTSPKDGNAFFIVACKVLENDAGVPPGSQRSWVMRVSGNASALGNIKAFFAACVGVNPDATDLASVEMLAQIDEAFVEKVVAEDTFSGMILDLSVREIVTKKGTPFSVHLWRAVSTA